MKQPLPPLARRLVLGGALLTAHVAAALPDATPVRAAIGLPPIVVAQDSSAAKEPSTAREVAEAIREATREARREIAKEAERAAAEAAQAAREAHAEAAREAREAAREAREAQAETEADSAGRKGFNVGIGGVDRHYDSFDQFLDRDPGLAFMVVGIVFVVFLTPILIIGLVIWYKIRRNRMQNETLLKLAEKGIVPSADALQAVGSGRADASLVRAASALPPAEQMQVLARRAAWSDLRKGIVMGTVGLALAVHSIIDDGQPGWLGLVLLFVGVGYIVLWYFEERQNAETIGALRAPSPPPRGPGFE